MGAGPSRTAGQNDVPQAIDWIKAIAADFETPGGSLDFRAEPPELLTPDAIEAPGATDDEGAWVEQFGLSVIHTPE